MAFNRKIQGAHIIELMKEVYGFNYPPTERGPGVPRNVDGWEGFTEGTVNGNYLVNLKMPPGSPPDNGRRRVVLTFIEPGGADAVPVKDLDFYLGLLSHIGENSLTVKDDHGRQVRFRVPSPYRAKSDHPDKLGPQYVNYTYYELDHDMSMNGYRSLDHKKDPELVQQTRPVIVSPFIDGIMADKALAGQKPKKSLQGVSVNTFWEGGRSHREEQNPDFYPLKICYAFGRAIAAWHKIASTYPETLENRMGVEKWPELLSDVQQEKHAKKINNEVGEGFVENQLTPMIEDLVDRWKEVSENLPKGKIHGDAFPDNVIMTGIGNEKGVIDNKIRGTIDAGIIDPWAACDDALMIDVGIILSSWCVNKEGELLPENAQAFLAGYDSVRQRTPEEVKATPLAAEVGAARFALTRSHMRTADDGDVSKTLRSPLEMLERSKAFAEATKLRPNYFEPPNQTMIGGI